MRELLPQLQSALRERRPFIWCRLVETRGRQDRWNRLAYGRRVTAGGACSILCVVPDIRLYEVPISYYGRSYAEGKKITWRDGFGAVQALVRFHFMN